ncbi:hypothetical protein JMUB6875_48250 [Nocardia sp. JMUB6875]|uniref:hypothetical protein n=1 Tax=Nocardia sp. JMUB6875 TaxID=3158170 RepID=UPI0032E6B108
MNPWTRHGGSGRTGQVVLGYVLTGLAFDTSIAALVVSTEQDLALLGGAREVLCQAVTVVFADTGQRWDRRPDSPLDENARRELLLDLAERVLRDVLVATVEATR